MLKLQKKSVDSLSLLPLQATSIQSINAVSYYNPNDRLKQFLCKRFKSLGKMKILLKASSLNLSKMYNHSSQCSMFSLVAENATAVLHSYSSLEEMETGLIPFCSRLIPCHFFLTHWLPISLFLTILKCFVHSDRVHLKYEINIKGKSEVDERIELKIQIVNALCRETECCIKMSRNVLELTF